LKPSAEDLPAGSSSERVHHDRNHFKQMLTNVQGYAWAQMGNAQKFSLPH
jgi:hypothetical protein